MQELPDVKFYGYTKVAAAINELNKLPNCNIIYSFIGGHRNYGNKAYCKELQKEYGAHICNLPKGKRCMDDCKVCLQASKVAFEIHGMHAKQDTYTSAMGSYNTHERDNDVSLERTNVHELVSAHALHD